jgi:hypothetical protein
MAVLFVWNEPGFYYVFKSWQGPVGRHIDGIAETTVQLAKPLVGREYAGESTRSGSGRLEASLSVVHRRARGGDVEAHAGANPSGSMTGYGWYHHEGAGPHVIRARQAKMLRFYWRRAGRVVIFRQVNHPGNPAQKYLTRALRVAMG